MQNPFQTLHKDNYNKKILERLQTINVNLIATFRQKIGDTYHFDLFAINEKLESSTVGYIIANSKTGEAFYSTTGHLSNYKFNIMEDLEDVKRIIAKLERGFSIQ